MYQQKCNKNEDFGEKNTRDTRFFCILNFKKSARARYMPPPTLLKATRATVLKTLLVAFTSSSSLLLSGSAVVYAARLQGSESVAERGRQPQQQQQQQQQQQPRGGAFARARAWNNATRREQLPPFFRGEAMAWRSHGTDNDSLVDALVRNRVLKTKKVIDAMRRVDRGNYCLPFSGESAYEDHPLPIGSNATISAPHMHAACLELAHDRIKENSRVLDVGSGSGYLTSCFAVMLDHHDTYAAGSIRAEEVEDRRPGLNDTNYPIVVGVEHIQELVDFSIENTKKDGKGKYLAGPEPLVVLKLADGREGYPPYAPFDVIHVGAASPEKPTKLLKQLANGGRLICPVGTGWQSLRVYDKDEKGNVSEFDAMGVSYVPLTSAKAQTERSSGFFFP
jgi:protein-L-isoaspartate(D-aspartate) O-methyltransferase